MLLKNCIYCIGIILCLLSIPTLVYTIKNKDRGISKGIICIDIISIVYLFIDLCMPSILSINIGLEILILYLFALISGILYIISFIINLVKIKKSQISPNKNNRGIKTAVIILLILPVLFLSTNIFRHKYLINNSELIVVYRSAGNGGFGDSDYFGYAISEDFCKQFDLGVDFNGYRLDEFLPKNAIEIKDINDIKDYKLTLDTDLEKDSISVYKDDELIHQVKHKSHYFNINFERAFYIIHN